MSKSKNEKKQKYGELCRELLALHNVELPSVIDIETFVHDSSVTIFFEEVNNSFINLWKNRKHISDTNFGQKNSLKNDMDQDGAKEIKSANKKNPQTESSSGGGFSPALMAIVIATHRMWITIMGRMAVIIIKLMR